MPGCLIEGRGGDAERASAQMEDWKRQTWHLRQKQNTSGNQKPEMKKKDQPVCSHSFDEIFCLLLRLFLSPTLPPFHGVGAATQGDCAHNSQYSIFLVVFLKRKRTEDEMVGGRFF